jgi:hypothetical protein
MDGKSKRKSNTYQEITPPGCPRDGESCSLLGDQPAVYPGLINWNQRRSAGLSTPCPLRFPTWLPNGQHRRRAARRTALSAAYPCYPLTGAFEMGDPLFPQPFKLNSDNLGETTIVTSLRSHAYRYVEENHA